MRFELESPSAMFDTVLEAGTIIGDDTFYPLHPDFVPGANMRPLDEEAKKLSKQTGERKENWGRPEENLPTRIIGGNHPVSGPSINRNNQPIIPPPMEHLTSPNDRRPQDGMSPQPSPIVRDMVLKENERIAAENDKKMAEKANSDSDRRSKENLPSGVTIENSGAQQKAQQTIPGQGPAAKLSDAPGQGNHRTTGVVTNTTFKTPESKK